MPAAGLGEPKLAAPALATQQIDDREDNKPQLGGGHKRTGTNLPA